MFASQFDSSPMEIVSDTAETFASKFHQPIADLLEKLCCSSSSIEKINAYSISCLPLIVFSFEGSLVKIATRETYNAAAKDEVEFDAEVWANKHKDVSGLQNGRLFAFFREIAKLSTEKADILEEIVLLRNAIAHSHVWIKSDVIAGEGRSVNIRQQGFQGTKDKLLRPRGAILGLSNDPNEFGVKHVKIAIQSLDSIIDVAAKSVKIGSRADFDGDVLFNGESISFWKIWQKINL